MVFALLYLFYFPASTQPPKSSSDFPGVCQLVFPRDSSGISVKEATENIFEMSDSENWQKREW